MLHSKTLISNQPRGKPTWRPHSLIINQTLRIYYYKAGVGDMPEAMSVFTEVPEHKEESYHAVYRVQLTFWIQAAGFARGSISYIRRFGGGTICFWRQEVRQKLLMELSPTSVCNNPNRAKVPVKLCNTRAVQISRHVSRRANRLNIRFGSTSDFYQPHPKHPG
ncbi:hypothetical protein L873DRAFT_589984 [Choiromyces venosus 120613-1]|uniref:Uncharacterized protein n=1 Tax=Choiromyces venosus 120613-1 TaxID=1336337 RepID=A0A3N4IVD7_9PEZI|nr:hypothetical protein L873DRAFT_589984 [Choiromyces venosus 120613-1]